MSINILMPALSPTMEEGTLSKWLVKEGDIVTSGDLIAEIETDKATMEVESIDDGTIGKILVNEGQESIKVNEPIAILLLEGENLSDIESMNETKLPEVIKNLDKIENKPKIDISLKEMAYWLNTHSCTHSMFTIWTSIGICLMKGELLACNFAEFVGSHTCLCFRI